MDNGLVQLKGFMVKFQAVLVLILIVVDNGLVRDDLTMCKIGLNVLILIVVDNGLVPDAQYVIDNPNLS